MCRNYPIVLNKIAKSVKSLTNLTLLIYYRGLSRTHHKTHDSQVDGQETTNYMPQKAQMATTVSYLHVRRNGFVTFA